MEKEKKYDMLIFTALYPWSAMLEFERFYLPRREKRDEITLVFLLSVYIYLIPRKHTHGHESQFKIVPMMVKN